MKSSIAMVIAPVFAFAIVLPSVTMAAPLGKKRPVLVISDMSAPTMPAPEAYPAPNQYGSASSTPLAPTGRDATREEIRRLEERIRELNGQMDAPESDMTAVYVPPSAPAMMTPEPQASYAAPAPSIAPEEPYQAKTTTRTAAKAPSEAPRPIVKIKFDQPDVDYEQPVYMAMSEALKRYPDAKFEMVAVSPMSGNAAQMAIESAHARRNAESVLSSLNKMGLDVKDMVLRAEQSAQAQTNEVVIMMR